MSKHVWLGEFEVTQTEPEFEVTQAELEDPTVISEYPDKCQICGSESWLKKSGVLVCTVCRSADK